MWLPPLSDDPRQLFWLMLDAGFAGYLLVLIGWALYNLAIIAKDIAAAAAEYLAGVVVDAALCAADAIREKIKRKAKK